MTQIHATMNGHLRVFQRTFPEKCRARFGLSLEDLLSPLHSCDIHSKCIVSPRILDGNYRLASRRRDKMFRPILLHFGEFLPIPIILSEVRRRKKRFATFEELSSFGVRYPDVQKQYPVISLLESPEYRCSDNGRYYFPFLDYSDGARRLTDGYPFEDKWDSFFRFLVV